MNDSQIEQMVKQAEDGIWTKTFVKPIAAWFVLLASVGVLVASAPVGLTLAVGGLGAFAAGSYSRDSIKAWRKFQGAHTLRLWDEVTRHPHFAISLERTSRIATVIRAIYHTELGAGTLPISQALRLLAVYDLQLQRQNTVLQRCEQLQTIKQQICDKSTRLQELGGDPDPHIATEVQDIQQQIIELEKLALESRDSCQRLEAILPDVERNAQIKQLQSELADLRLSVSSSKAQAATFADLESMDIERQISREIETFLQLERETDQRLRAL